MSREKRLHPDPTADALKWADKRIEAGFTSPGKPLPFFSEEVDRESGGSHTLAWVTVQDAAGILGVTLKTIRRRIERGTLRAVREPTCYGFRWRVLVQIPKRWLGRGDALHHG